MSCEGSSVRVTTGDGAVFTGVVARVDRSGPSLELANVVRYTDGFVTHFANYKLHSNELAAIEVLEGDAAATVAHTGRSSPCGLLQSHTTTDDDNGNNDFSTSNEHRAHCQSSGETASDDFFDSTDAAEHGIDYGDDSLHDDVQDEPTPERAAPPFHDPAILAMEPLLPRGVQMQTRPNKQVRRSVTPLTATSAGPRKKKGSSNASPPSNQAGLSRSSKSWAREDVTAYIGQEFDFKGNLDLFNKAKVTAQIHAEFTKESPQSVRVSSTAFSLPSGELVSTATPEQCQAAENYALEEPGASNDAIISAAGKATATVAHCKMRGTPLSRAIVLCGNNKYGAIGISAACRLASLGVQVCAMLIGDTATQHESVADQISKAKAGPACELLDIRAWAWPRTGDADESTLIIDAMLGHYPIDAAAAATICEVAAWTRSIKDAVVFSVEMPSGLNASTGDAWLAPHSVAAHAMLCLGAPTFGALAWARSDASRKVYLARNGVAAPAWRRAGVTCGEWGSMFVVLA